MKKVCDDNLTHAGSKILGRSSLNQSMLVTVSATNCALLIPVEFVVRDKITEIYGRQVLGMGLLVMSEKRFRNLRNCLFHFMKERRKMLSVAL